MGMKFPLSEQYLTTKLDAVVNWSRPLILVPHAMNRVRDHIHGRQLAE